MTLLQKLKELVWPTPPKEPIVFVQPDPKPGVVEVETVLTVAPEKESAVEMPTQPFQVPVTNTDPTPTTWPFPSVPPVEPAAPTVKKKTATTSKKQQFEKKTPVKTTTRTKKSVTAKKK